MSKNETFSLKNLYSNLILYIYGNSAQKTNLLPILGQINQGKWGEIGQKTIALFMEPGTISTFIVAHRVETYLAKII